MSRSKAGRARRDALVGAAQRAMLEHGADTKLRHVAEAAGLTSGAVLYHFPDVQALLVEANRAGMERFYDERVATPRGLDDPVEKLVVTIRTGLPVDGRRRLGAPALRARRRRRPPAGLRRAAHLALRPPGRDVPGDPRVRSRPRHLHADAARSLTIARNLVALEDAYGYRMVAGHPTIDHAVATELILDYARVATGHPLDPPEGTTS